MSEVPTHVAIIMDGNGRWAQARGLPRVAGHRQGAEAVRRTVRAAADLGVRYLTLYSFSSENWKRPLAEVEQLMELLRRYLRSEIAELYEQGVRLRVIGDRDRLAPDIVRLIEEAETTTRDNDRLTLVMALSYGSRQEMAAAARAIAREAVAGRLEPEADPLRLAPLHGRHSRPRSADPNQRRDARQQLPAVAARLCGVRLHRALLAGLRPGRPGGGGRGVQPARATLRCSRLCRIAGAPGRW